MKKAVLLYPHQLFPLEHLPQVDAVVMIEDPLLFGLDQESPLKIHKQKLIFQRASMRRYAKEVLWPQDIDVEYIACDSLFATSDIFERTRKFDQLSVFDPVHEQITKRLLEARRLVDYAPQIEFLASPNFLLKDQEVREYFHGKHQAVFDEFYIWQRERFDVLITEDYKPEGGEWRYATHASRLQKDHALPSFQSFGDNEFVHEAVRYVGERFANNPGDEVFIWPTNHAEAGAWLDDFVAHRLPQYAAYYTSFAPDAPWMYHSALSACLNSGLLQPQQVIEAATRHHKKHNIPLESIESFIRGIVGWREFMRGFYVSDYARLIDSNPFKQHRRLTAAWYSGDTGILPYDEALKHVHQHGYAHHTERALVLRNLMILSEIHPDDMHSFFSQLFVDAQDWAVVPAVYGAGVNIHGKAFADDPIITPASQLIAQSDYERGAWSDVWDGLYWRFVEKHKTSMLHNPTTRPIAQRLDRLDVDHRRIIGYRAEDFLKQYTLI